jgi:hypothetical protein
MASGDQFQQVGEDFKLHDEVLVVVTDADGAGEPTAMIFWRPMAGGKVEETEPNAVEETLAEATAKGARLGRPVVVQLDNEDIWWPHWGTLTALT